MSAPGSLAAHLCGKRVVFLWRCFFIAPLIAFGVAGSAGTGCGKSQGPARPELPQRPQNLSSFLLRWELPQEGKVLVSAVCLEKITIEKKGGQTQSCRGLRAN